MNKNSRVFNETRRQSVRLAQALRAIENCAAKWVEYGISIRDLKLNEAIEARNEQARKRALSQEVLGSNELPGLKFVPPATTYRAPREAYEEMESPLGVRVCRWPRLEAA